MENQFFILIVIPMAACAVIDVFEKGGLFSKCRSKMEAWRDCTGWRAFIGKLMTCTFCQAYHLPWMLGLLILLSWLWWPVMLIIYSLAITKLITLVRRHLD